MRKQILAANWKMNLLQSEVDAWLSAFQQLNLGADNVEIRIYPSAIYIKDFRETGIHVGAQNVYEAPFGAYTGEISVGQLKSVGASSVLIGHSERRKLFNETDEMLAHKISACVASNLSFVLCCGEPLEIRSRGEHLPYVLNQVSTALRSVKKEDLQFLVISYEPIWAIGTGNSASNAEIAQMHLAIRNLLLELFGSASDGVQILYGGSVNSQNAKQIFSIPNVDGALVGGASLDINSFEQLFKALTQ